MNSVRVCGTGDIRALVSADEKVAKDALWRLSGNIYHQGTRYTATAPAIPYLVEAALAAFPEAEFVSDEDSSGAPPWRRNA